MLEFLHRLPHMARKTKEEAQATRTRILDAAEGLFLDHGVSRTSLHEIASAAGVTRGAVYWHFKDKIDLFNAMMDRVFLPTEECCAVLDGEVGQPVLPLLRGMVLDVFTRLSTEVQMRRVLEIALHKVEYVDELSALRERRLQVHQEFNQRLTRALQRAQARGEVAPGRPAVQLAFGLHALVDGLLHNWLLNPAEFDLPTVGMQAFELQIKGMQA